MKPFTIHIKVQHDEIDALGHVNNAVYQRYLEQAAMTHSQHLGFTLERYQELGGIFVIRRIEMEYLRPAIANDVLAITTWVMELRGACALRRYEIHREHDRHPLLTAEALWVWVDGTTMRPRSIPGIVQEAFGDLITVHG